MDTWKRNLYVIAVAEVVAIAGFSVISPFLPYYVQELGVTDIEEVELWSGTLFAAQSVTMALFAPIWGAIADRYGRKLMVERAMFGGAVVLAAMGFVQNVQQLAVLRAFQGMLTGTVAAAMTLVASSTPRARSGYALGLLQMAIWAGASIGPLIGGFVSDAFGYRAAFLVTGGLLFVAGVTVARFVEERFTPPPRSAGRDGRFWHGFAVVARSRPLLSVYGVSLLARTASYLLMPLLPLFIQSLVPESARVASLTGIVSFAAAAASAVGALTVGRATDRAGPRRVLLLCLVSATLLYVPMYFVRTPWQLVGLQALLGLTISGVLAAVAGLMARLAPEGLHGAVYGVDSSVTSLASAAGPMLGAGVAAVWGLRLPFLLAAGTFTLSALLAAAVLRTALPGAPSTDARERGDDPQQR